MNVGLKGDCHLRRAYSNDHVCSGARGEQDTLTDDPSLVTCRQCKDENVYLEGSRVLAPLHSGRKRKFK